MIWPAVVRGWGKPPTVAAVSSAQRNVLAYCEAHHPEQQQADHDRAEQRDASQEDRQLGVGGRALAAPSDPTDHPCVRTVERARIAAFWNGRRHRNIISDGEPGLVVLDPAERRAEGSRAQRRLDCRAQGGAVRKLRPACAQPPHSYRRRRPVIWSCHALHDNAEERTDARRHRPFGRCGPRRYAKRPRAVPGDALRDDRHRERAGRHGCVEPERHRFGDCDRRPSVIGARPGRDFDFSRAAGRKLRQHMSDGASVCSSPTDPGARHPDRDRSLHRLGPRSMDECLRGT
jgi:hypothetical protein